MVLPVFAWMIPRGIHLGGRVNPDVADLNRPKPLNSSQSPVLGHELPLPSYPSKIRKDL